MPQLSRLLFLIICATLFVITTGFSGGHKINEKPRAPISIEADKVMPVEAGTEVSVTFFVTPLTECLQLSTRLRGLGGVTLSDTAEQIQTECTQGTRTKVSTKARIPSGQRGSVALDVELKTKDGELSASRSVPVIAADAVAITPKASGNLKTDSSGERLIITPASELPQR